MFQAIVRFAVTKKLFVGLTTLFLLADGIYAMLTLPVEQVQYLYIADEIVRAVQSAAESRILPFTLDELAENLDPDLFPCQPPVFDFPSFR